MVKMNFPLGSLPIGTDNAVSCNFSASAGVSENCWKGCGQYDNGCYAQNGENFRPNLKTSGLRREKHPVLVLNQARLEMRNRRNIWFRFSSRGSVPKVGKARKTAGFESAFKALISEILESGSTVHLPVESLSKRLYYQALCDSVSPGSVVVRESVHSERVLWKRSTPRAFVVGEKGDGCSMPERIAKAYALRDRLIAAGVSAIVCAKVKPARFKGRKAKCGDCKACAVDAVDVVLYPFHR
mgnify:CR=1 FL=1